MNLVFFEILSLPGLTEDPAWNGYIFTRKFPSGELLVQFMDFPEFDEPCIDIYLDGEEVSCELWVAIDIPDREQMVADLERDLAQTALRYCQAQPGDYEYTHIEKICSLPRIARHRT